jgi:hydrogenase-4 component F
MTAPFVSLLPGIVPAAAALIIALAPPRASAVLARLAALALAGVAAAVAALGASSHGPWDAATVWWLLPTLALSAFGLMASLPYLSHEADDPSGRSQRRYLALYAAFAATIAFVTVAPSLLLMWGAVEATTLASVFLVAHPDTPRAVEASWKYLVVTAVGGLLALIGVVIVAYAGHLSLAASPGLAAAAVPARGRAAVLVGFAFAAIGFGTKAGLAPMHGWLPDAHSEAPAPVSGLLSGIELAAAVYALARVARLAAEAARSPFPADLLIVLGFTSLLVAALFATGQTDLKRLFAYSSVEHMGLLALGLGVGGIAAVGAALHVWTHGTGKAAVFFASGEVRHRLGTSHLPEADRILGRLPKTGWILAVGGWAVAGLPPFGLFFSEWLILWGTLRRLGPAAAALALVLVIAVAVGIGRFLPRMLIGSRPPREEDAAAVQRETWSQFLPAAVLAGLAAVLGLVTPAVLPALLSHAARLLAAAGAVG